MKNMLKTMAVMVLLALGVGNSQAQTAYTNAAPRGCYGFLSNSVDVAAPNNRSTVGTICFDGMGNIIPSVGSLDQTGWWQNTGGIGASFAAVSGTYGVTNNPGQGMGYFSFPSVCGTYAFSINTVDSTGLAHGFQFSLVKACTTPKVIGGTAYLQP
jgi:hypothetical protein